VLSEQLLLLFPLPAFLLIHNTPLDAQGTDRLMRCADVFEPKDKKLVLTFMAVRVERWAGALTALKRHKGVGRGYIPQGLRFIVACKLSRAGGWGAGTIRHEKLTIASHGVQLHACTTGAGYTLPERARSATACRQ